MQKIEIFKRRVWSGSHFWSHSYQIEVSEGRAEAFKIWKYWDISSVKWQRWHRPCVSEPWNFLVIINHAGPALLVAGIDHRECPGSRQTFAPQAMVTQIQKHSPFKRSLKGTLEQNIIRVDNVMMVKAFPKCSNLLKCPPRPWWQCWSDHHLHLRQGFALLLGYCLIRHVSREETTLEPVV